MPSATYRTVLRTPGAAGFFLAASVGRVGIAGTSLGLVWLVHARTGSYAAAGIVTGGFAVAEALAGPQLARLIDRHGQTRVLPVTLLVHAAAVAALLVMVAVDAPRWALSGGGVLVGASIPQLGALSAVRWAALLRQDREAELPAAFAVESLSNALAYLAGPVLVSTVAATGHAALGTVTAAVLVVAGGLVFAAQRRSAPPAAPGHAGHVGHSGLGRGLLRPGFLVLVGINLTIGVYFGAMQVSVTAFAVQHAVPGTAAVLFAVSSCAGLLAGWLYGLRRWRTTPQLQLVAATAGLALACLLLLIAGSPVRLGFAVAVTGAAIPPILVLCGLLTEAGVHPQVLTQGFTWLNSASAAGSAGATAIAGRTVDVFGAHAGFTLAITAATTMLILAAGTRALSPPKRRR